jgi:hypothetical protein
MTRTNGLLTFNHADLLISGLWNCLPVRPSIRIG